MDILLLTALRREMRTVRACFADWDAHTSGTILGRLGSRRVVLVQMGVGMDQARRATSEALKAFAPKRSIAIGFAGGLDPALATGTLLIARCVLFGDESVELSLDGLDTGGAVMGPVLTVQRLAETPLAKQALHESTGALAVDMESYAVADECRRHGVPVSVVRAISDSAGTAVPARLAGFVDSAGNLAPLRSFGQLAAAPTLWPDACRLLRGTHHAAAAIRRFLGNLAVVSPIPRSTRG